MASSATSPNIPVESIQWRDAGKISDPKGRLLAHIKIAGVDMHLEAIAVRYVRHRQIAFETSNRRVFLTEMREHLAPNGHDFEIVQIGARKYVLFASPYFA